MALAITALSVVRDNGSENTGSTKQRPEFTTLAPTSGIYPKLPVGTEKPPPYPTPPTDHMMPMLRLCGTVACDVEGLTNDMSDKSRERMQNIVGQVQMDGQAKPRHVVSSSRHPRREEDTPVSRATGKIKNSTLDADIRDLLVTSREQERNVVTGLNTMAQTVSSRPTPQTRLFIQEDETDSDTGPDLMTHTHDSGEPEYKMASSPGDPGLTNAQLKHLPPVTYEVQPQSEYNLRSKQKPKYDLMAPLIATGVGNAVYQPFSIKDMTALASRLPRVSNGGGKFIQKVLVALQGHVPSVGDMRQILAHTSTQTEARNIEATAQTQLLPDVTPLTLYAQVLFNTIRDLFPDPVTQAPSCFPYSDIEPSTHYSNCVQKWTDDSGRDPGHNPAENIMFRTAILAGLPSSVKSKLDEDPDLLACDEGRFKRHLTHHLRLYRNKQNDANQETDKLKEQLLKLQLAKARKEATQEKSEKHEIKKCINTLSLVSSEPPPAPMMLQAPVSGGRVRGRGGYRGRRGGPRHPRDNGCFKCGELTHWANECPHGQKPWQPGPQQQRGGGYVHHPGLNQARANQTPSQAPPPDRGLMGLVDTGASMSSINLALPPTALKADTMTFVGFSGTPQILQKTYHMPVEIAGQTFEHSFVHTPQTPVNLIGRDVLVKTGASILCAQDGLKVTFPNGYTLTGVSSPPAGQWLMAHTMDSAQCADIYWGLLEPESPTSLGLYHVFLTWKPWILSLRPYLPPPDPLHCTLYYDREGDQVYADAFFSISGQQWEIQSESIFVGPEGVSAHCVLSTDQLQWYRMSDTALPHISLALSPGHEARELGPMTKRGAESTDWQNCDAPGVLYSPKTKMYCVSLSHVTNSCVLEHICIDRHHGRECTDHEHTSKLLDKLPDGLWSGGPFDVGSCTAMLPVEINVSPGTHVYRSQYRWVPEADRGMDDTLTGLWNSGVIERSTSSWCTSLRPVLKADGQSYRMAHDLRPVNDVTITPLLPVPDPHRMLSTITPECKWFTVIDLANAFFCIPLHSNSRHIFAFKYKGVNLQYTRLPQGLKNSPGIFNQCLKTLMQDVSLPAGCVLLMYVDDLLLAAPTAEMALRATELILLKLHSLGFKVSKKKLQCCRREVTFLGRTISGVGAAMSTEHRNSILKHKRPNTVREMLAFLGLCGYSRHYIPCFVDRTKPLRELVKAKGMTNLSDVLDWNDITDKVFVSLVQDLASAAALATPDYKAPFHLDASMTPTVVNAVLFQKMQGRRDVLMYCSVSLDSVETRSPPCTRYAAGLAKVIQKTAHIVMAHPLIILTEHSVTAFVASASFTLSSLRQTRLLKILTAPNIQYHHEGINMSDGMNIDPHSCSVAVNQDLRTRPDMLTSPLKTGRILFTDGCCFRTNTNSLMAAAAVVEYLGGDVFETLVTKSLQDRPSAQAAEVLAICLALESVEAQPVTIYSDSAYAVSAATLDLASWKRNDFMTAKGEPIAHRDLMTRLDTALALPSQVAIVKIPGHSKGDSFIAQGNNAADTVAKYAAGYTPHFQLMVSNGSVLDSRPAHDELVKMQAESSPEQKTYWKHCGAVKNSDGLWTGPHGQPVLPDGPLLKCILTETHGPSHVGPQAMMPKLTMWWHPQLRDLCHTHVNNCTTCQLYNVRPTLRPQPGTFDPALWPGAEIVTDYTDMINPV